MHHKYLYGLAVVLLGLLMGLTACGEAPGVPHPQAGAGAAAPPAGAAAPAPVGAAAPTPAGAGPAQATPKPGAEGESEEGLPPPNIDLAALIKELEKVQASDVSLSTGSATVELVDFEFKPKVVKVKAGDVNFVFKNPSTHAHNYRIAAWDNHENIIYPGPKIGAAKTREDTIALKSGVYYVFCNLSDHEQRGMVGKLIVE